LAINDAHEPPPAADAARRPPVLRIALATTGLFGLFALAALTSWMLRGSPADPEPEPTQSKPTALVKIDRSGTPADLLQRGDDALLLYRFKIAIDYYEAFLEATPSLAPLVEYRVALCYECMNNNAKAIVHFRSAIQTNATQTLTFACHLGVARCLLRQSHPLQARRLCVPILMDEEKHQSIPPPMLAEAHHLVALSFAQESHPTPSAKQSIKDIATYLAAELEPSYYLDEISIRKKDPPAPKDDAVRVSKMVLQKQEDCNAAILQKLTQVEMDAKETFDRIVVAAGLQAEWTASAKKSVEARPITVSISHRPLIEVLELLADHCDVAMDTKAGVVRFTAVSERNEQQNRTRSQQIARRSLLRALQFDSSNVRTAAIRIELANIETASGNTAEARKWYEDVLSLFPASSYTLIAGYNLAQLHLRNNDITQARAAFYNVIHRAPGHELALKSQIRLGLLFLEEEKSQHALSPLRTACVLGMKSGYQPFAVLALTTCHLKMGEFNNARLILATNRECLAKDPYNKLAIFLDAYAQFQHAKLSDSTRRESAELLNSLWNQADLQILGPTGYYLYAQSYTELGFYDEAEKMLRQGAQNPHTPLIDCIEFNLAQLIVSKQHYKEARELYTKIADRSPGYRKQAGHQLASLDLLEGRLSDCVQRCSQLWKDAPVADPIGLLKIWGAAHERLGDLQKASICYSGKAPE